MPHGQVLLVHRSASAPSPFRRPDDLNLAGGVGIISMQQQGYQPFPYYNQAMYPPQTPHLGANNGAANGHQGYAMNPYFPMQQNPYMPAAPAPGPAQMNGAPLTRPRKYTQPEPKLIRNGFPLRSAMKQPARPDATPLGRQRTISGKGPDGLARHRTRSNPTPIEEARPEFIPS